MRLLTFDDGNGPQAGVLIDEDVVPVSALDAPASSVKGLLGAWTQTRSPTSASARRAHSSGSRYPSVRLLAPVPDPEKIICLGLNYARPRGGVRPGDPDGPAAVRQVRELPDRPRSGHRAAGRSPRHVD